MTHDQLAKRIAEVALLRGEFTLRSGRKSNYYLDKYRFETQPDVLAALGKMLADRVTVDTDRMRLMMLWKGMHRVHRELPRLRCTTISAQGATV